jgi:hypothetical protein
MNKKSDKSKSAERARPQDQEATEEEIQLELELGRQIMREYRGTLEALAKESNDKKEPE